MVINYSRLYEILEQMIKYTAERDKAKVISLDNCFEAEIKGNKDIINDGYFRQYDLCRQSCVMSFNEENESLFINDAYKRFFQIE